MKKCEKLFYNGQNIVPVLFLVLFPVIICFDLLTTYMASPDLKYEANPIIRHFQWGWYSIVICNLILFSIYIFLIITVNKFFLKYFRKKGLIALKNKSIFYISCCFVIFFYSVFVGCFFSIINNYFVYLYLYQISDNVFYSMSLQYINFLRNHSVPCYLAIVYSVSILIGVLITIYRINCIQKYVNFMKME